MWFFLALILCVILVGFEAQSKPNYARFEVKIGVVQKFLLDEQGTVNGFLLQDKTKIKIPTHMSAQIMSVIKLEDIVTIKGYRASSQLINANTVVNTSTSQAVDEIDYMETEMVNKFAERKGAM